jgi:hypothetical protein
MVSSYETWGSALWICNRSTKAPVSSVQGRCATSKPTDIFHVESLQAGINGVENVLSTETAIIGVSVLFLQHVLVHTDTLETSNQSAIKEQEAGIRKRYLFPVSRDGTKQLCRNYNLVSRQIKFLDSLAGDDLADAVRVDVGRIEKVDTGVVGGLDQGE